MFFRKTVLVRVNVEPEHFSKALDETLGELVRSRILGKPLGIKGFVVYIYGMAPKSKPLINPDNGFAEFVVEADVIVLRPFVGEVLDVAVASVAAHGVLCKAGPLIVHIHRNDLPLSCQGPESYQDQDSFRSDDGSTVIRAGTLLRVRISTVSYFTDHLQAFGSLRDEYLGVEADPEEDM